MATSLIISVLHLLNISKTHSLIYKTVYGYNMESCLLYSLSLHTLKKKHDKKTTYNLNEHR